MTVEEAIVTALQYETKVRDHYLWATSEAGDPQGKVFFEMLAKEEQGHVDYLNPACDNGGPKQSSRRIPSRP